MPPSPARRSGTSAWSPDSLRTAVLELLDERVDEIVEAVLAAMREEVAPARQPGDARDPETVRELGRWYLRLTLSALDAEGELEPSGLTALRQIGRDRFGAGVRLDEMLRGYQVGMRVLWEFVLAEVGEHDVEAEVSAALLEELSQALLQLTSTVNATISEAYMDASQATARNRERIRHELWEELLTGPRGSAALLRRRAESAGYRLGDAHVVAMVAVEDRDLDAHTAQLLGLRAEDALRGALTGGTDVLVGQREDTKLAVYALEAGTDERTVQHGLQWALRQQGLGDTCFASIGRTEPGVEGIATSHRQASRTLEMARETGLAGATVAYVDALPELLLTASPDLAADLWRATLEPLVRHDRARGSDLVLTIRHLVATGGNRAETAKRLHVHRHTLSARLRRIEQLSGREVLDPDQMRLLGLGLHAHRLFANGRPD